MPQRKDVAANMAKKKAIKKKASVEVTVDADDVSTKIVEMVRDETERVAKEVADGDQSPGVETHQGSIEQVRGLVVAVNNKLTNLANSMTEFFEANKKVAVLPKATTLKVEDDPRIDQLQETVDGLCEKFCELCDSVAVATPAEPTTPEKKPHSFTSVADCMHKARE